MYPSHILMHFNRKHRNQHPASRITLTNESEVKRAKKFLGLDRMKPEEGAVAVVRKPEEKRK